MARPRTGLVWDIRPYSIHDGPGIRTTVFLKGCPLRCAWCCNPEAQRGEPEIVWLGENCLGCGACLETCPRKAISKDSARKTLVDRRTCDLCGVCVERCPGEALRIIGRFMTVPQVLEEVGRDAAFHGRSGGGMTLSGGEPFAQPEFTLALLGEYKRIERIGHTAVETCGLGPWEGIRKALPLIDLVLFDVKHMDGPRHRDATGGGNRAILANARRIARSGARLILRFPLIPGLNDTPENIEATVRFAESLPGTEEVHLLAYHRWGEGKHARLGRTYALAGTNPPRPERLESIKALFERRGFRAKIGG